MQTAGAANTSIYGVFFVAVNKEEPRQGGVERGGGPAFKMKCRLGVHSGYNSCLLKQEENSGSATATFRDFYKSEIDEVAVQKHMAGRRLSDIHDL